VTRYRVLERFPGYSYVRCALETGRTHQIRVHMAYIGHPVAGDPLYGGGSELGLKSQCLHARAIRFIHPSTGQAMSFESGLPEDFTRALAVLRARL
jgi:23S rRNA pseudouridine1911/1915/1917 synthase